MVCAQPTLPVLTGSSHSLHLRGHYFWFLRQVSTHTCLCCPVLPTGHKAVILEEGPVTEENVPHHTVLHMSLQSIFFLLLLIFTFI